MIEEILALHKVVSGSNKRKERQLLEEIADLSQISNIESRVKGHQSVFYDTFGKSQNSHSKGYIDLRSGIVSPSEEDKKNHPENAVMAGATKMTVLTDEPMFQGLASYGTEVTIFDDEHHEDVIVSECATDARYEYTETDLPDGQKMGYLTSVPSAKHQITITTPLKYSYKLGAVVCRSNAKIDKKLNMLTFGTWKDPKGVEHDLKFNVIRYNLFPVSGVGSEVIMWMEHMSENKASGDTTIKIV